MPFKDGTYKHEDGFVIMVQNGTVMISPNHPLSIRISDVFDTEKWEDYYATEGETNGNS